MSACERGCKVTDRHRVDHPEGHDCPGCLPVAAVEGSMICDRCRRLFAHAVRDLASLWPDLQSGVSRSSQGSSSGRVQTSGHSDVGDMWRPRVTDAIDEIADWATFIGRVLADDARNRIPMWPTDTQLALRIAGQPPASRWLVDHPVLGASLVDDALEHRVRAYSALQSPFVRRIPLSGKCMCEVMADTVDGDEVAVLCNAPLVAVLQDPDSGRGSTIVCKDHPRAHAVPKSQWVRLSDDLEAARNG